MNPAYGPTRLLYADGGTTFTLSLSDYGRLLVSIESRRKILTVPISRSQCMNTYMVVATFKEGVTQEEIRELIPAEQAQAKILEEQGLLGEIKVAMPRRTVFLEAFAKDEAELASSIGSLPLAKLWDLEFFATTPPAGASVSQ